MRLRIDQYNPRVQSQIAAELEKSVKVQPAFAKPVCPVSKPRIRQNAAGLNKTEQAFSDYLRGELFELQEMFTQAFTLKLGNGVRYTPDFVTRHGGHFAAYEVKGFMRDDACVKIKVAASIYAFMDFFLVTKRKGGGWDIQPVLP